MDYTVRALSKEIQLCEDRIRRMICRGEFPGAYKIACSYRIPQISVDEFRKRNQVAIPQRTLNMHVVHKKKPTTATPMRIKYEDVFGAKEKIS